MADRKLISRALRVSVIEFVDFWWNNYFMHEIEKSSATPSTTGRWANSENSVWMSEELDRQTKDPTQRPLLANYLSYREYLKDFYLFKRATHSGLRAYSYSVFSAAADIKSPNYLKLIIDGKRNLSDEMTLRFARAMQLNKAETGEFRLLVRYGQESDALRRNQYLRDLADLRLAMQVQNGEIEKERFDAIPNWVSWVLLAMCDQEAVSAEVTEIKKLFRGKASEDQIKQALKLLVDNEQIELSEEGFYIRRNDKQPQQVVPALIRKLQAELNYLGLESLFEDSAKIREFGTLTVALTEEEFERYRFELRQLRKRLHKENAVSRETSKGQRVYQLNTQLFPLTDPVRK